jgi:demethylmenaquinone methyltransferase / 2-methoxy-6-polyprenyl-1,4-benzoquinol methylase
MTEQTLQGATKELDGGDGVFFDAIAHRYDLLNRILSLGLDGIWRRRAVKALDLFDGATILDLATGTGDLALEIGRSTPNVEVIGVDPSQQMVAIGQQKVAREGLADRVTLGLGDGQALAFDADTFDGAVVSFGIRNFPDRLQGLREMTRVTRKGRPVVVLELSEPRRGPMAFMARTYVHQVVPRVGSLLSGSKEYRYLQESIAAFPPAEEFARMMELAGLEDVEVHPLTFGVVNLYVGRVA